MHKKVISQKTLAVLGFLVLIAIILAIFFQSNSKVTKLSQEKIILMESVTNLTTEKNKLASDNDALEKENVVVKNDFNNFKTVLKQYFSNLKVLDFDAKTLVNTALEYYQLDSKNYSVNKPIVDKYEFQLDILKNHLTAHKEFLKNNGIVFDEIGIDTKKEIKSVEESIPKWEDTLYDFKFRVEALRFEGTITDALGRSQIRTYTITNLDYEVEIVAINTKTQTASFNVNGAEINDLKIDAAYKLPDGAELGVISILKDGTGADLVKFYLGK